MNAIQLPAVACAMVFALAASASSAAEADKAPESARVATPSSALAQQPAQTVAMNSTPERLKLSPKAERDAEPAEPSQLMLMLAMFAGLFVFLAHRRRGQE